MEGDKIIASISRNISDISYIFLSTHHYEAIEYGYDSALKSILRIDQFITMTTKYKSFLEFKVVHSIVYNHTLSRSVFGIDTKESYMSSRFDILTDVNAQNR